MPALKSRELIAALRRCHWNQVHAAAELGVSRNAVKEAVARLRASGQHVPTFQKAAAAPEKDEITQVEPVRAAPAPATAKAGPKHLYIPDTQVKPDVDQSHIEWAGAYAGLKRPDVIVIGGDWYDMPSLSSYDEGKLASHGRRYQDDIDAGTAALKLFERALAKYGGRGYKPRKVVTLGNHEERILRAVDSNPKMEGKMSMNDLAFKEHGWVVYDFLAPVEIHGIVYAHYFPLNANGQVSSTKYGAPSARAQVERMKRSCTAGHRQGLDVAIRHSPTATYRGVIAGSFYRHQERYLTPMGENYWRGILVKHDIDPRTGNYNLMEVDMRYLERRFG